AHDVVVPSIANSLRYVTLATALDLVVGTTIAYLVTRTRSRAARVLDAAAMLPLVVRSAAAGLAQISRAVEEAAASLGAGAISTFMRVTLPLLAPHLMAGG